MGFDPISAIIFMQFPPVLFLIILSYQASNAFKSLEFSFITIGWVFNFLYLILALLNFIDYKLILFNSNVNFELERLFEISSGCFFIFGFIQFKKCSEENDVFLKTLLTISAFALYIWVILYTEDSNLEFYISFFRLLPNVLFTIFSLILLAYFYSKMKKPGKEKNHILTIGTYFYAFIQILAFGTEESLQISPNIINLVGFGSGLFAKMLIYYGNHRLFLIYTRTYVDKQLLHKGKQETLGKVIHEVKNPLKYIDESITEALIEYTSKDKFRQLLTTIESSNQRIIAQIDSALHIYFFEDNIEKKVSKTNPYKYKKYTKDSFENVNVNTLLEISIKSVKVARDLQVNFIPLFSSKCNISCNPNEIIQLFVNIINNSFDSFPHGEGIIKIKTYTKVETERNQSYVYIEISDNGHGIDDEIKAKIFELGFTIREGIGRGHGLNVSQEIVHNHKGEIFIYSNKQKKQSQSITTTVYIKLPK